MHYIVHVNSIKFKFNSQDAALFFAIIAKVASQQDIKVYLVLEND